MHACITTKTAWLNDHESRLPQFQGSLNRRVVKGIPKQLSSRKSLTIPSSFKS